MRAAAKPPFLQSFGFLLGRNIVEGNTGIASGGLAAFPAARAFLPSAGLLETRRKDAGDPNLSPTDSGLGCSGAIH